MFINRRGLILILILLIIIIVVIKAGSRCSPSSRSNEPTVKLYLSQEDKTVTLSMEEYIVGVVGAEMPASFGAEALKAQAVTARTYTLKRLYAPAKHPHNAQMCDDIRCCQAYINPQQYEQEFGKALYEQRFIPIGKAVAATRGQVMTYEKSLIDTPYFSTCGGHTASAAEVWGQEVAYLKSVRCDFCKSSKRYNNQNTFSLEQVNKTLKKASRTRFQLTSRVVTASGRLQSVTVDGRKMSGAELRRLFDLPSTQIISVRQQGDKVIFQSRGYGHGVGLCQYGASGMAREGYRYPQILGHYYQGIKIVKLNY